MKKKIYHVVSSSYETSDNYLHQESYTYTDEDKAREKFNALRGSAKIEIEGDEDSEVEYSSSEDDYENRYQGSREVGTEMEYQVIVELKEVEIEVLTIQDVRAHLIDGLEKEYTPKDIKFIEIRLDEIRTQENISLEQLDNYCYANSDEMFQVIFDYKVFDKSKF